MGSLPCGFEKLVYDLGEAGGVSSPRVVLHQPLGPLGVQSPLQRDVGGGLGCSEGVECITRVAREQVSRLRVALWTRRYERQNLLGNSEHPRLYGLDEGLQGPPLLVSRHDPGSILNVAPQCVVIIQAPHQTRRSLNLIPVREIEGNQNLLQARHGLPDLDPSLRETLQRHVSYLQHPLQLLHRVSSVHPGRGVGVGAGRPGVLARREEQSSFECIPERLIQRLLLVDAVGEVLVAVGYADLVPLADPGLVRAAEIYLAVLVEPGERRRVVHDAGPVVYVGAVVVAQAQGVAHLVDAELPYPGEGHLHHPATVRSVLVVVRDEALRNKEILAYAEAAETNMALDDLPRPRVRHCAAVAPASGAPVDPVDHVVPDVHGVGVQREELHPEGAPVAGRLEGQVPPRRTLDDRGPDRLRDRPVDVVHDGLHRLADFRRRVLLFQAVSADEPLLDALVHGARVVYVRYAEVAGPGIVLPRLIAFSGELYEAVVLAHRHYRRVR